MDIQKCFDILELEMDATADDVRQAYRDLVSIWHPDRHAHNARLRQKAEEKLKEINIAYHTLQSYLTLKTSRGRRFSFPDNTGDETAKATGSPETTERPAEADFFRSDSRTRPPPASRKSYWRTLLVLLLISLIPVSVFTIQILRNMRQGMRLPAGIFEQTANQALHIERALKSIPADITPEVTPDVSEKENSENSPEQPKKYIQIHLKNESIILTTSCWEKNNMIMFEQSGGTIGVEKSRVRRIVRP